MHVEVQQLRQSWRHSDTGANYSLVCYNRLYLLVNALRWSLKGPQIGMLALTENSQMWCALERRETKGLLVAWMNSWYDQKNVAESWWGISLFPRALLAPRNLSICYLWMNICWTCKRCSGDFAFTKHLCPKLLLNIIHNQLTTVAQVLWSVARRHESFFLICLLPTSPNIHLCNWNSKLLFTATMYITS